MAYSYFINRTGLMTYQVIDRNDGTVLETWPTLKEAEQACAEICVRWGQGEAYVKAA